MNEKNRKDEIAMGLIAGIVVGVLVVVGALAVGIFQKSLIPAAAVALTMFLVLYCHPKRLAIYKNLAFVAGLFIAAGFMGYVLGSFVKILALVAIGLSLGFAIKIMLGLKKKE